MRGSLSAARRTMRLSAASVEMTNRLIDGEDRQSTLFYGEVVAGLGPVGDQAVDDDVADAVGVVECGQVGAVLADFGFGEAFGLGGADALLIEVRGGAEDEDAVDVEFVCLREPGEGLQGAGVLHAADGAGAVAGGLL